MCFGFSCLLERCVMQHQSTSAHRRYVIFVSFQTRSSLSSATCFFLSFLSFCFFPLLEEAAWSCQGPLADNNLGWRMTPWEWQMKRNQILPGANCMELIQPSPHFPARKHSSTLTYLNRGSSLILDTRPGPKSGAARGNWVRKLEGKLSNCTSELMTFNLFLSQWAIMKNREKDAETLRGDGLIVPLQ